MRLCVNWKRGSLTVASLQQIQVSSRHDTKFVRVRRDGKISFQHGTTWNPSTLLDATFQGVK